MSTPDPSPSFPPPAYSGRSDIDLDAIAANVRALRARAANSELMVVVKGDAYGHGLLPVARAALAGGAGWLGAAQPTEALALRRAGLDVPVFTWLYPPGTDLSAVVAADIDVAAAAPQVLDDITAAVRASGRRARVHLKIDTGLARGGAVADDWPALVENALQRSEEVDVVGIWSHLVAADEPGHPSIAAQKEAFAAALEVASGLGLRPRWRHLANSAATLTDPELHYDLVRTGLAVYGLTPLPQLGPPAKFGLVPALTLSSRLALVKQVPAGQGVSYGHTFRTSAPTWLGLVPLGYADGIPRHASSGTAPAAEVWVDGRRAPVVGRVCMDQFVVDLGPDGAEIGSSVTLFGSGQAGEPTAQDWADAAGSISYEVLTRLGVRIPRHYRGAAA